MGWLRFQMAKALCRHLPPLLAQRVRNAIYPLAMAYADDFEFVTTAPTGALFQSRTSDYHAYQFGVHGYFDWRNWAIAMSFAGPGSTIIEIGANIGTETVGYADIVYPRGKVFSFEPLVENRLRLQHNLELNGAQHVTVFPLAVGDRAGTVQFCAPHSKHDSGIGHIVLTDEPGPTRATISVQSTTLDAIQETLGRVAIVFIDAEGAEPLILAGGAAYLTDVGPPIVLEASSKLLARSGSSPRDLLRQLDSLNYDAFVVSRFGLKAITSAALTKQRNWLCIRRDRSVPHAVRRTSRMIRWCGAMPMVLGMNPLRAPRNRRRDSASKANVTGCQSREQRRQGH